MINDAVLIDLLARAALTGAVAVGVCSLLPSSWRVCWLRLTLLSLLALPAIRWGLPAVPLPLLAAADPAPFAGASGARAAPDIWPAYATIAVLILACSLGGLLRLRRRSAQAAPARLDLPNGIEARWCARSSSPLSFGWLRPVILLPAAWAGDLQAPRVAHCLAHELAHIDRGDWLWLWLQKISLALYWAVLPLWWLNRQLSQATELAADQRALARVDSAAAYARTLLEINAGNGRRPGSLGKPAMALAMAGMGPWRTRIEACFQPDEEKTFMTRLKLPASALLALTLLVPLAACQITRASEPAPMPDKPAGPEQAAPPPIAASDPIAPMADPAPAPAVPVGAEPSPVARPAAAPKAAPASPGSPASRPHPVPAAPETKARYRAESAEYAEKRARAMQNKAGLREEARLREHVASLEAELARVREALAHERARQNQPNPN